MRNWHRLLLVIAVMLGLAWPALAQQDVIEPLPVAQPYPASEAEMALNRVFLDVVQSVVNITVAGNRAPLGTGSGFVIDTEGHIVTNNHVVEGASYIEVTFYDGVVVTAELVGLDPSADLAVIKVDPTDPRLTLQPVEFASTDDVFVGQRTMAIGSPFGESFTLTTGIVSAIGRSIRDVQGFSIPRVIQTDAAINPGNSGGPLMYMLGEVIGVNTAILSATGVGSGVGFAIPADTVRRIVPYLIAKGEYKHSYLGITGAELSPSQREAMRLPLDVQGVMVADVVEGSPADAAGLRAAPSRINTPFGRAPVDGDIIVGIEGEPVRRMNDIVAYLEANTQPGDEISLTVWRDGELIDVNVVLQERPRTFNLNEDS